MTAFWARAGRPTRVLVASLMTLGVCVLTAGLLSDRYGWWTSLPFLTNLASGLTSACFGVPFALLVLSSLTSIEDEQQQQRNAENLRRGALEALEAAVRQVTSSGTRERVDAGLDPLTRTAIERAEQVIEADGSVESLRHSVLTCQESLTELHQYLRQNFSYLVDMEEHWASTCAQWRFLDDYVKPRGYEQQLDWIRPDAAARFDTILRNSTHPLASVIPLREHTLPELIGRLSRLTEGDDEHLVENTRSELHGRMAGLNRELTLLRGQLPRTMRLREAMAIAQGLPFEVDLTPGHGLQL